MIFPSKQKFSRLHSAPQLANFRVIVSKPLGHVSGRQASSPNGFQSKVNIWTDGDEVGSYFRCEHVIIFIKKSAEFELGLSTVKSHR